MIDYGLKRADYITAFFKTLDWKAAKEGLSKAAFLSPTG